MANIKAIRELVPDCYVSIRNITGEPRRQLVIVRCPLDNFHDGVRDWIKQKTDDCINLIKSIVPDAIVLFHSPEGKFFKFALYSPICTEVKYKKAAYCVPGRGYYLYKAGIVFRKKRPDGITIYRGYLQEKSDIQEFITSICRMKWVETSNPLPNYPELQGWIEV